MNELQKELFSVLRFWKGPIEDDDAVDMIAEAKEAAGSSKKVDKLIKKAENEMDLRTRTKRSGN